MVEDANNFDDVRQAFSEGLSSALEGLYWETLTQLRGNLSNGKDALGNDWEPLDESTIRAKGHDQPLYETGVMLTDINKASEFDRSDQVGVIGTTLKYPEIHETGKPEVGIPRRPIFGPAATYANRQWNKVVPDEVYGRIDDTEL